MNVNKDITYFGDMDMHTILGEFGQLDEKEFIKSANPDILLMKYRKKSLRVVTLIKEKQHGRVKVRACIDGSKHHPYITKEGSTSPILSTKELVTTLVIDAHKNRDIITTNILGAYLNTFMNNFVIIILVGNMVNLMGYINPEKYGKRVQYNNKRKLKCIRVLRALYEFIKSRLLWYTLFAEILSKIGFIFNS